MGGRKLARYVLEVVVGRCADAADTVYHCSARNVKYAFANWEAMQLALMWTRTAT
jgi:hypothetical protein